MHHHHDRYERDAHRFGRREPRGRRPWAGGDRGGYPGGPRGLPTGGMPPARYGVDFRAGRERGRYDEAYRDFGRRNRPLYSPVGGTHAAMGGAYRYDRPPAPLRDARRTSEWTRWF